MFIIIEPNNFEKHYFCIYKKLAPDVPFVVPFISFYKFLT